MLVSVLMPTYNRADYIEKSIKSVLEQSYQNFELIIVDDGSTDNTASIVKQVSDKRINYYQIQHTGCVSKVRNVSLSKVKGKLIAFLDSDDIWLPHHLSDLTKLFNQDKSLGIIFSDSSEFNSSGVIRKSIHVPALKEKLTGKLDILPMILNHELPLYPSAILMTKDCIDSTGLFDESFSVTEINYIGRAAKSYKAMYSPKASVAIRKHNTNHSDKVRHTAFEELFLLMSALRTDGYLNERDYKKLLFKSHYRFGIERIECKDPKRAKTAFAKALKLKPWSFKSVFRWLMVCFENSNKKSQ